MSLFDKFKPKDEETVDGSVVEIPDDNEVIANAHMFERARFDIARSIAPESATIDENWFKVGDDYCRTMYVHSWPDGSDINPDGLKDILRFHQAIDVALYIQPIPLKPFVAELNKQINRDEAFINKQKEDQHRPEPEDIKRLESNQALRNFIGKGETKPFQIMCMVTIRAKSVEELDSATRTLENSLKQIVLQRATFKHKEGFNTTMPLMENELEDLQAVHYFHTQSVMNLFPFSNSDITHENGVLIGVNQVTNTPIILNRFLASSVENPNTVIIGGSGSGKSYFAKTEQLRWAYHGVPIVTLDPSGEFVGLAEVLGGTNINISLDSGHHINPLDFSYAVGQGDNNPMREKIQFMTEMLRVMLRVSDGGGSGLIIDALTFKWFENALLNVYAGYGYYVDDPESLKRATPSKMPTLSEAVAMLKRLGSASNDREVHRRVLPLVDSLDRFINEGSYAPLFDNRSNIDIKNSPYINFNYHNLSDDLTPMAMHLVLEFFRTALFTDAQRESGINRLLYVDEAQILMKFPETAHFLDFTSRTCRKYGIGLTVITQNVGVFAMDSKGNKNEVGSAVLANSKIKVLFKQEEAETRAVKDVFLLNDNEVARLLQSRVGEGIIRVNDESCWFSSQGMASPRENRLCTTNTVERAEHARADAEQAMLTKQAGIDSSTQGFQSDF